MSRLPAVLRGHDFGSAVTHGRGLLPAVQNGVDQVRASLRAEPQRASAGRLGARRCLTVQVDRASQERVAHGRPASICRVMGVDELSVAVPIGREIDRAVRVISASCDQCNHGQGSQSCHFTRIIDPIPAERNGQVCEPRFAQ